MRRRLFFLCILLILFNTLTVVSAKSPIARAASISQSCVNSDGTTHTLTGALGGANYLIQVPSNWKGTLLLYSHGYTVVGSPLTASDASDPLTGGTLLQQGYALAGSSYSQNGWALQQAFHDQIALLDFFNATCGQPVRTIPWGDSLGGMITAGLVQLYPNRFAGAMPLCGVLAGGIGTWNQALDSSFAFSLLLTGGALPVVHITNPSAAFAQSQSAITVAQSTPQGRARIALISALADLPGWFNSTSPEPASNDFVAREQNQFLWQSQVDLFFATFARAELESRAGGNPSWNTGVNYRAQLERSVDLDEVEGLYAQAGLNLNQDLDTLNAAPRIQADSQAVPYLSQFIVFDGQLNIPVLTMHTTGDGLVVNEDEQAYAQGVRQAGDNPLLRQVFVHRAGHCTMTPAERLTAISTLIHRLDSGKWEDSTEPTLMNQEAGAFGPVLNLAPPAFIDFDPARFLRPFTTSG